MADHDLVSIWTVLSTTPVPTDQSLSVVGAVTLADGREVLAGIDRGGDRHVLVPLRPSDQFKSAGQGLALQLRLVSLSDQRYASAVCTDRRLDEVFAQFGKELVASVATSGKPGRDMTVAFGKWRALFSDGAGNRLNKAEEIGLLGELLTLRRIIQLGGSVVSWEGPTKALHDFRRGHHHLEVKATTAREGLRVEIHGIGQLAANTTDSLHLLVYRFAERDDGESLVDVVRSIEGIVDDLVHFEVQLRRAGFEWQHASNYETGYGVVDNPCFDVLAPSFPRVTSESFVGGAMPAGTMNLAYTIDLSGPSPVPLEMQLADGCIRMIAAGE